MVDDDVDLCGNCGRCSHACMWVGGRGYISMSIFIEI